MPRITQGKAGIRTWVSLTLSPSWLPPHPRPSTKHPTGSQAEHIAQTLETEIQESQNWALLGGFGEVPQHVWVSSASFVK